MTSGVPNVVELTNPGWGWVNKTTLSYTFLAQSQLPAYYTPVVGNPAPGDKYFDVTPLSQAQQDAVVDLLKYVQSIIPIGFDPSNAAQLGDMTFGFEMGSEWIYPAPDGMINSLLREFATWPVSAAISCPTSRCM
jgi:hypothetical protein